LRFNNLEGRDNFPKKKTPKKPENINSQKWPKSMASHFLLLLHSQERKTERNAERKKDRKADEEENGERCCNGWEEDGAG
jgi:hypothetical protein